MTRSVAMAIPRILYLARLSELLLFAAVAGTLL